MTSAGGEALTGSDQRGARLVTPNLYVVPQTFTGRVCFTMFETAADLRRFVPYPLELVDPHRAFIKVYQLKMRPIDADPLPPAFSQYLQVCLCVLAAPPGQPVGHYNLMLWEIRDWSLGGAEPHGWRKKLANIETTYTFPTADRYDVDTGTDRYQVEVEQFGRPIMSLRANLSGGGVVDPGISGGFLSVRYHADGDPAFGTATADVMRIYVEDTYLGPPASGLGELAFWPGVGYGVEEVTLLEALSEVRVEGVTLRDVGWLRRVGPAQKLTISGRSTPGRMVR